MIDTTTVDYAAVIKGMCEAADAVIETLAPAADAVLAVGAALLAEEYEAKARRRTGKKRRKALRQARAQRADLTRARQRIAARERQETSHA